MTPAPSECGTTCGHGNGPAPALVPARPFPSEGLTPEAMTAYSEGREVHAVAGIGHPERFFRQLEDLGVRLAGRHAFPDHHAYSKEDFACMGDLILMTEKDAVKLRPVLSETAQARVWVLPVSLEMIRGEDALFALLGRKLSLQLS